MIRDDEAKIISDSNVESIRIRSVLTCESLRGVVLNAMLESIIS